MSHPFSPGTKFSFNLSVKKKNPFKLSCAKNKYQFKENFSPERRWYVKTLKAGRVKTKYVEPRIIIYKVK
jgi:hypothetical protein